MGQQHDRYLEAFSSRHACKEFDSDKVISKDDFDFILETARLSPSSFGLEPWKILVIQDKAIREKLLSFTWGGQKQIPTASHLMIALSRTHHDMHHQSDYISEKLFKRRKLPPELEVKMRANMAAWQQDHFDLLGDNRYLTDWAAKQSYIVLGNMMNAAALIGIDSCPIEGFVRSDMTQLLADQFEIDPERFSPAYLVAFGYRKNEPKPKIRSNLDELVTIIE